MENANKGAPDNRVTICEGEEYQVIINDRVVFEGIAESDTAAQETLMDYVLHSRAIGSDWGLLTFRLAKL